VLVAFGLGLLAVGFPVLAAGVVPYGAGVGIGSIDRGTLPLALFGPAGYAALMGRLAMPMLLAGALAPSVGALLLERAGAPGALATLAGAALARAVRWDEVAQAQSEFVRASLERLQELNRCYLEI